MTRNNFSIVNKDMNEKNLFDKIQTLYEERKNIIIDSE